MKFLGLVWAGIWRRRGRAILSGLSIINAFVLLGVLMGFQSGLDHAVAEARADRLITFSKVMLAEPLPVALVQQIRSVKGVKSVFPVLALAFRYRDKPLPVAGVAIDIPRFVAAYPTLKLSPGALDAMARTRSGAIVGEDLLRLQGWKVGDRQPLQSLQLANHDGSTTWPVDIVGTYGSPDKDLATTAVLLNYDYFDEGRVTGQGTATYFMVVAADPTRSAEVASAIDRVFANSPHETKTATQKQLVQESLKAIGDIGFVVRSISGAVFFALLISVGSMLMQSVHERMPELAVLKTLGFSDLAVMGLILSEALILCVGSAAIGLGLVTMLFPLAKATVGLNAQAGPVMLLGLGYAAALAVLGGLPPAIRGLRLQVVDAMAGR
jgi:putative ABC transport system permease protein